MTRPAIDYDTNPTTFDELLRATEGQAERKRVFGYVPKHEAVVVEPEAFLDLLRIVDQLRGEQ